MATFLTGSTGYIGAHIAANLLQGSSEPLHLLVRARSPQEAQERLFDWLDAPVMRVTGTQSEPVVSKPLEQAALAGADSVRHGFDRILEGVWP